MTPTAPRSCWPRKAGHYAGTTYRPHSRAPPAGQRRLPDRLRQLPQYPLRGKQVLGEEILPPAENINGPHRFQAITQAFDPEKQLFLADRFIKEPAPAANAGPVRRQLRGLRRHLHPAELIDPVSAISGATPIEKDSIHFFFKLPEFEAMLRQWLDSDTLQPQVANKLREWTEAGLQEWDISRDAPYFGFEIPEPGKYFYVWLDAPIGYIASFQNYCERTGHAFDPYWLPGGDTELYHFIGKDIINFHGLFWPAMLHSAGLRTPVRYFCPRLHRKRHQDVQEPRHLYQRQHLSGAP